MRKNQILMYIPLWLTIRYFYNVKEAKSSGTFSVNIKFYIDPVSNFFKSLMAGPSRTFPSVENLLP
jgi:hypothetical protein